MKFILFLLLPAYLFSIFIVVTHPGPTQNLALIAQAALGVAALALFVCERRNKKGACDDHN